MQKWGKDRKEGTWKGWREKNKKSEVKLLCFILKVFIKDSSNTNINVASLQIEFLNLRFTFWMSVWYLVVHLLTMRQISGKKWKEINYNLRPVVYTISTRGKPHLVMETANYSVRTKSCLLQEYPLSLIY